jgi:SAM-dependent methyltransferase
MKIAKDLLSRLYGLTRTESLPDTLLQRPFPEEPTPEDLYYLYRLLLRRIPDPEGWACWKQQLPTCSLEDLVQSFLTSAEFQLRQSSRTQPSRSFEIPAELPPDLPTRSSQLVTQKQIDSEIYAKWCQEFNQTPIYNRKQWEHVYTLQALEEVNMLQAGKRGLGFGVGREWLMSVLVKRGCSILATDLDEKTAQAEGWRNTDQQTNILDELCHPAICDLEHFRQAVSFRVVDMNHIPNDLKTGGFDFVWSSCSLEHLGSLEAGLFFIKESLKCLKPGGLAIHTTEYNVSSNDDTLVEGPIVLYRRRDIDAFSDELRGEGYIIQVNLHPGDQPFDKYYDVPPFVGNYHMKLLLDRYVITSLGLLIYKP